MLSELEQAGLLVRQKKYFDAEKCYRNILAKDAKDGRAWLGLGNLALLADMPDKALSYFNKACHLLPTELPPLVQLASTFNLLASEADALKVLRYAVERFPLSPQAHYQLALQYIILGDVESALVHLQQVSESQPSVVVSHALYELSRINGLQGREELLPKITSRLASEGLSEQEQIVLCYAMAQIEDALGHYSQAFHYLQRANQMQLHLCEIRTAELQPFYQRIKQICQDEVLSQRLSLAAQASPAIVPVFILGLPRTGSTLLEQCLVKHTSIATVGEAPYMGTAVANALHRVTGKHFPDALAELSTEQMEEVRDTYLGCLAKQRLEEPIIIDKMPANFQAIGLIYKLFPQAKVINLKRNIADVALSVFKNYFAENEPYFCDLGEFKQYNQLYEDLMQHWRDALPGFILDIHYEDLVRDTRGTLQAIMQFCQLPWQENCLAQTEVGTAVKTLSNIQVRQAIHSKSVGTSHHYAEFLTDFISR